LKSSIESKDITMDKYYERIITSLLHFDRVWKDYRFSIKRLQAKRLYTILVLFLVVNPALFSATKTSIASGNWSTAGIWSPSGIPGAGDTVIIANSDVVTVDINNATCDELHVSSTNVGGGGGTLAFAASGVPRLTVAGNVTIGHSAIRNGILTMASGGTLICNRIIADSGFATGFTYGSGTIQLNATNTLPTDAPFASFNNLVINGGTTTTSQATTINGKLVISATAELDIPGFDFSADDTTLINGTLTHSSSAGARTFNGPVIISNNGTWHETANPAVSFGGNLQNDGTLTAASGIHTCIGSSNSFGGANAISFPNLVISGNYTNYGVLTIATSLAGTGSLTQGLTLPPYPTINLGGTVAITSMTAYTTHNTINYYGGAQSIFPIIYNNLSLDGNGTKTMTGVSQVRGNLALAGTVYVSMSSVLDISGDFLIGSGATFITNGYSETYGGSFTNNGIFNANGGTITFYYGVGGQSIGGSLIGQNKFNNVSFSSAFKTWTFNSGVEIGGNFSIATGTVTAPLDTLKIAGNILNSGKFIHNNGTVFFNGSNLQSIGGDSANVLNNVVVSNSNGISLTKDLVISGNLSFINGKLTTGANNLTAGAITGAGALSYVYGNLQKNFPAGGPIAVSFEIGDSAEYAPVTVSINNVAATGYLRVKTTAGHHPAIAFSGLSTSKDIDRYWTLTNYGISFDNYYTTFNWPANDVDSTSNTSDFVVAKYDNPNWLIASSSGQTPVSITANNLTSFSDFAVGEERAFTITADAGPNGTISPGGDVHISYNASQHFSIRPNTGYHVDSLIVDGTAIAVDTQYTFINIQANHTIHTAFAINHYTITGSSGPNGTISPTGSLDVIYGDSIHFGITTNTGHHIDSLVIDGVSVAKDTQYTFRNIAANHTIYVSFAINLFTISATTGINGSITPSGIVQVNYNANQHFSFAPVSRFHIVDSLIIDGTLVPSDTQYTFNNVTSNHTIRASFKIPKNLPVLQAKTSIQDLANQVSVTEITSAMRQLEAFKIRWADSQEGRDSLARTRDWLIGKIQSYGYTDIVQQNFTYNGNTFQNIVVTKTGTKYPDTMVILDGHYDSVNGPGIDDNASGVALTLEAARILANINFEYTVKFIFFSVEEEGLIGSRAYVQNVVVPGHYKIRTVINNDMVSNSGGKNFVNALIDSNVAASRPYADTLAALIELYSPLSSRMEIANNSDFATFAFVGYPTTGFFEAIRTPHYHQQSDSLRYCDTNYAAQITKASIAALAHFAGNRFTIAASAGPNGAITPAGITIISYNGSQHYSISPNTGYHVDSLIIDGTPVAADTQYTFSSATANHTIRAAFAIDQFTITATAGANGSISPNAANSLIYNSSIHFSITPNIGYHVDSLIIDGALVAPDSQFTFNNVIANHTIHAAFAIDIFTVTPSAGTNGTISPSIPVTVSYGDSTTFTLTPIDGYHVDSIFIDGVGQLGKAARVSYSKTKTVNSGTPVMYTFHNVMANHTIYATFAINKFIIAADAGANGTINPAGTINALYGDNVHFSIVPGTGYHVDSLLIDGTPVAADTQYTFNGVNVNHTIHAAFTIDQFTITTTAGTNGSITPSGAVIVIYNASKHFNIAANAGYHIDSLFIDGTPIAADTQYTFSNVTANHTIHAVFAIDRFTITASAGANGSITPSGALIVNYHSYQHFSITPNTGYHVDSLIIDGVPVAADTQFTFNAISTSHTILATFAINVYTVTPSAGANGTISPFSPVNVNYGDSTTFTLTPIDGFHVDSIFIDGIGQAGKAMPLRNGKMKLAGSGVIVTYTFHNVTASHTIHATFTINKFTITAEASPNGSITPSGVVNASYGDNVYFSVTPNTGYHVDSLIIDGISAATDTQYSFNNVAANHVIHVAFAIDQFTITATAGANGIISPNGSISVNYNASKYLSIVPNTGYHVDSLIVDETPVAVDTQYTFSNVKANHAIRATFAINVFTITASWRGSGRVEAVDGSGGVDSPIQTNVNYGDSAEFRIWLIPGIHIDSFVVDGVLQAPPVFKASPQSIKNRETKNIAPIPYMFHNVTANHTLYVTFATDTFTIIASAGPNGTITPSGTIKVEFNSILAHFSIIPNPGYHVDSLLVDGIATPPDTQYTFDGVQANHTISVTFALTGYIITVDASTHGTLAPSGSVFVQKDSSQTFSINPDIGCLIDSILIDGVAQAITSTYTFTHVTANHTIRAVFVLGPYNISAASGDWSNPSTWSRAAVPANTDSVIITPGKTISLDINGVCGAFNLAGVLNYSNDAGRTLTVTTAGSRSGNVIVSDTLTFAAQSGQRIFIGGDFTCTGTILSNSTGTAGSFLVFNGSGSKTIVSNAQLRGLQVNNPTLELALGQPLTIQAGISLTNGKIVLGNYDLTLLAAGNISSGTSSSYMVTNGSGRFIRNATVAADTFPVGTMTSFNRITLATGISSDMFAVRVLSSVNPGSAKDSAAIARTIEISRAGTDSLGLLTMTFNWDASEQGPLFVPASASSWRHDGTAWVEEGTFVSLGTGPYVGTISNIVNMGKYVIGNAGALPITLAEFRGLTIDVHSVRIDWTTMSEQNTYGFYIQRQSEKTALYTDVSDLIGGAGTSINEQHAYSWTDSNATDGIYYYRLRTVDLNGDVEYSSPIKVNVVLGVEVQEPLIFKLSQNYPNPFNPSTTIRYSVPTSGLVSLKIFNILGQEVATLVNEFREAGRYSVQWNAGAYPSGSYFYRIIAGDNIKHMRMILVK
jgi:hypothetical protein